VVLRIAEEGIAREAAGFACDESLSEPARGDFGLVAPFPLVPGLRKGDAVRLTTGGV
jgi:hypothetical protein